MLGQMMQIQLNLKAIDGFKMESKSNRKEIELGYIICNVRPTDANTTKFKGDRRF